MFSYGDASPSLPSKHRRGGPVHVRVLLRELEADLVETYLTAGEHGHEQGPDAARPPSQTPYPPAA